MVPRSGDPARAVGTRLLLGGLILALLLPAPSATAFVLTEDELEERSTELGLLLRSFNFIMEGRVLRPPFSPQEADPTGISLLDARVFFEHRTPRWKFVVHNQLTLGMQTHSSASLMVTGRGPEPLRLLPLEAEFIHGETFRLSDRVDWIYCAVNWGRATITAGRQPVTLGRGKIWAPSDLVATFALTEVDTEYKPGADALRIDLALGEQSQLSLIAAAGKWDGTLALKGSSLLSRLKLGWSRGEAGLLAGFVRNDAVLGLDGVYDAGAFDLYAEATLTLVTGGSLTPRRPETDRAVARAVVGATFKPLAKVTVSPELYYNGFGSWDQVDYLAIATSERVAIGELTTVGPLYLGVTTIWEAHPLLQVALLGLANLRDPSGLLSLSLQYNVASNVMLGAGAFIPLGQTPATEPGALPTPRGEYGLYPRFYYLQIKAAI